MRESLGTPAATPQTGVAPAPPVSTASPRIGLLTGGDDRSYALGLASSLMARGVHVDFVGSNQVDAPELHGTPLATFLNLRGDQSPDASLPRKVARLLRYYLRLMVYAATTPTKVLHILWNNKFEHFDRTLLMLYYRMLGHRVVLTAHNVNAAKRDSRDSVVNRLTLRIQYRLCDHVFVHTQRMREELVTDYGLSDDRISVIPFGINDTAPKTLITDSEARARLGLSASNRVLLFFGQIAPYKGLEYLVEALPIAFAADPALRLVIAGKVKQGCEDYWRKIAQSLANPSLAGRVLRRIEHVPDAEIEVYFKAADVLVIPYVQIFQSGVPFLAYSFGLPVIATDVGELRSDVVEGRTGYVCRAQDPGDLAQAIARYFAGPLFSDPAHARAAIRSHALDRHSWAKVAEVSEAVYLRSGPGA